MIVLETERLHLRQWGSDDWVRFKPLLVDPRVTQYVPTRDWTDEKIQKPNVASIRVMEKIGMIYDGVCDYEGIEAIRYVVSNSCSSELP